MVVLGIKCLSGKRNHLQQGGHCLYMRKLIVKEKGGQKLEWKEEGMGHTLKDYVIWHE